MQFVSTRDPGHRVSFSQALIQGLAPDGGLYMPEEWPSWQPTQAWVAASEAATAVPEPGTVAAGNTGLAYLAAQLIAPFAADDPLAGDLATITGDAFDFPAPLVWLDAEQRQGVLELFHGPTAAFKDFGARFLAASLGRLRAQAERPLKILVATSGDTGGAVAAAFYRRSGFEVAVLYPKGLVSPTQERQLTCWGHNVASFAVRGSFDDCQRLVKLALVDPGLRARADLSSANSINVGRLLPQVAYYLAASLAIRRAHGGHASFVIPSGNLGNATACVWARRMGAPIGQVVLAHNANRTVPDYLADGVLRPRPSVPTVASAMDVGNPSNLERLSYLYPDAASLRGELSAISIDDAAICTRIRSDFASYGRIWCPHTAAAAEAYARLPPTVRGAGRWVMVATAHPAKFREIVEPLIGCEVPVPSALARLFERPSQFVEIEPQFEALEHSL